MRKNEYDLGWWQGLETPTRSMTDVKVGGTAPVAAQSVDPETEEVGQ